MVRAGIAYPEEMSCWSHKISISTTRSPLSWIALTPAKGITRIVVPHRIGPGTALSLRPRMYFIVPAAGAGFAFGHSLVVSR